jgi:hypothetical protein
MHDRPHGFDFSGLHWRGEARLAVAMVLVARRTASAVSKIFIDNSFVMCIDLKPLLHIACITATDIALFISSALNNHFRAQSRLIPPGDTFRVFLNHWRFPLWCPRDGEC